MAAVSLSLDNPYHLSTNAPKQSTAAYDAAWLLSRLSFSYLSPLFALGRSSQRINLSDIDAMPAALNTQTSIDDFCRSRTAAAGTGRPSLFRLLLSQHGTRWAWMGVLQAASTALSFAGPLILNRLLAFLQADDGGEAWYFGAAWSVLMAAQALVSSVLSSQYNLEAQRIQTRIRAGLFGELFAAALAPPSLRGTLPPSTGQLMNHVSVDTQQILDAVASVHQFWSLPLQVAITLYLLYTQVSWAFIAGCAVLLLFTPLNMWISKRIGALTAVMMRHRDERVQITGEVLRSIRVVKMQGWEGILMDRIAAARALEVSALAGRKYLDAVCVYLWASTPVLVSLVTFAAVVLFSPPDATGTQLSASVVFTTLSLLNMLIFPMNALPWVISGTLQAWVSLHRLEAFLFAPVGEAVHAPLLGGRRGGESELQHSTLHSVAAATTLLLELEGSWAFPNERSISSAGSDATAAAVDSAADGALSSDVTTPSSDRVSSTGGTHNDGAAFVLHTDIAPAASSTSSSTSASCFDVGMGELVVVCGVVGAGKTALLSAIIGDMIPVHSASAPASTSRLEQHDYDTDDSRDTERAPLYQSSAPSRVELPAATAASECDATAPSSTAAVRLSRDCTISYAPQVPWIRGITLRDNIVCGEPWDAQRYAAVLAACELDHDLSTMSNGGDTRVSTTSLSGGQQQRIGLARALYARSTLLLADDCLSALDAHVGSSVWERALGPLPTSLLSREHRARVVVTHDPRFFHDADTLVLLVDGAIAYIGPPDDAFAAAAAGKFGPAETHLLGAGAAAAAASATSTAAAVSRTNAAALSVSQAGASAAAALHQSPHLVSSVVSSSAVVITAAAAAASADKASTYTKQLLSAEEAPLPEPPSKPPCSGSSNSASSADDNAEKSLDSSGEEARAVGLIRRRVILSYARFVGGGWVTIALVSLTLMQLSRNADDWWLSVWSAAVGNDGDGAVGSGGAAAALLAALTNWSNRDFLLVFGIVAGVNTVSTAVRAWSFAAGCLAGAVHVHDRMLRSVLSAPMSFHDATPLGRLLNRFSADQFAIDDSLPFQFNILLAQAWGLVGTLLILAYATYGLFLVAAPLILLINWRLQNVYRHTSRELKRLDSTTRSVLFSHLTDCLAGGPVIRARSVRLQLGDASLSRTCGDQHQRAAAAAGRQRTAAAVVVDIDISASPSLPGLQYEQALSVVLLDDNQRTSFTSGVASQWLGLRLQFIGASVLAALSFSAVLSSVLSPHTQSPSSLSLLSAAAAGDTMHARLGVAAMAAALMLSSWSTASPSLHPLSRSSYSFAGTAGLALSYAIPIVGAIQGLIGAYAETEKEFVAVERVQEYVDVAPEEEGGTGDDGITAAETSRHSKQGSDNSSSLSSVGVEVADDADFGGRIGSAPSRGAGLSVPLLQQQHDDDDAVAAVTISKTGAAAAAQIVAPRGWRPSFGAIEFRNVTVQYPGTSRPAVSNFNLSIKAGEHVAVMGRTGSGKSTLVSALWRMNTMSSGSAILIDGTDISGVHLSDLRCGMSIIPQTPVLFTGSVAWNLDPNNTATRRQLLLALVACGLHDETRGRGAEAANAAAAEVAAAEISLGAAAATHRGIQQLRLGTTAATAASVAAAESGDLTAASPAAAPWGRGKGLRHFNLDDTISEGGGNLSLGEKQLLCLARALVHRTRVCCIDEATAATDVSTDNMVNEVIRTHFTDVTMIVIAHRLRSLALCDRVVVMRDGKIAELGSPQQLISGGRTGSARGEFEQLAREQGASALVAMGLMLNSE